MVRILSHKIFEVEIITSSFYFVGIICMSSHCSTLSPCCIMATVCSIRYFNWDGFLIQLANWQLTLAMKHLNALHMPTYAPACRGVAMKIEVVRQD